MQATDDARRDRGEGGRAAGLTYLAVCSSDDYLDGLLVLNESLRRVRSRYPLTVLLGPAVSRHVDRVVTSMGIHAVRSRRPISVPVELVERNEACGQPHWSRTFEKLEAFELVEFRKVVYLDTDMLVMRNVDDLFDRPHLAAVAAGRSHPGNESWERLNSGCLVIVPRSGSLDELWRAVPTALSQRDAVGDQDLIQIAHPDWPDRPDLHLGEEYNLFFIYLEHYRRELGYSLGGARPIKIVHFVGAQKPWMRTPRETVSDLVSHLRRRQWASFGVLARYHLTLRRARLRARLQRVRA